MGCKNCCRAKNQADDGTGLRKDGERDGAFLYYKSQKDRMTFLNLDTKSKDGHHNHDKHVYQEKFLTRKE